MSLLYSRIVLLLSLRETNASTLDLFVKMLLKPSHLFLRVSEAHFSLCLRESLCKAIIRCVESSRDPTLSKSLLFTFLKSFVRHQNPHNVELLNAMALVANLSKLLDSKEVFSKCIWRA